MLIPGYPEGSDLTIIDTAYIGRRKDDNGKYQKDYISIVFKDNTTGLKHNHIIYEPKYTYYQLDKGYSLDHNLFFIEKEKVVPVETKYVELLKDIAEKTGNEEFFYDNIRNGSYSSNRRLHTLPEVFMSDLDIEDYYRMVFDQQYKNDPCILNKAYLDIEADTIDMMGDFPEPGECPINAVGLLDENSGIAYQFLLENDKNPLIDKYKKQMSSPKMMEKLKQFIIQAVGGYKKAVKYGVDQLQYQLLFFKDEIELIHALFEVIKQLSPDTLLIWNMAFDLEYIVERIRKLGYDPLDFLCDDRIKERYFHFYVDERNKNEYAERGDYVNISQFTVWLDQMIQLASRRKGRGQFASFKLDDIGQAIAGVRKLDYSHITSDIAKLPYLNFLVFSWYNFMDVIVQKCIEMKTQDVDYIFAKCLVNNTRYSKGHRQSVYLANRFTKDFYSYGYIIGNNTNKWNEKPEEKYPGAMVGDTTHNSTYAVVYINGMPTLLAMNVVDYDYKALYPSITLENNMAPNTQIGKYELVDHISYMEHQDMYTSDEQVSKYCRAGEFLENMMSGNHLEFCKRWLHLADFRELEEDMREYFDGKNHIPSAPIDWEPNTVIYQSNSDMKDVLTFDPYQHDVKNALFFYNDYGMEKENIISRITKGAYI